MKFSKTTVVWLLLLFTPLALAERQIIHAGVLLVAPGDEPLTHQSVVVNEGVVERVVAGYLSSDDVDGPASVVDLRDKFVMPGLIDLHVHLLYSLDEGARLRELTESGELQLLRGVQNAYVTLQAGFTTVRDLGGHPESIFALRDATEKGLVPGPRILAAGTALAATGGHGDVDGVKAELMELWTPESICDGVVACRRSVRNAVKYGADWIKITATGGVLSDTGTGLEVQMTDDELAEIVRTAQNLNVRVAVHAHGTSGILAALRAGVDTIDHGSFQTRETIELHRRTGAYFVPTLMPGYYHLPGLENNPAFSAKMRKKARAAGTATDASFRMALENDVRIAFGTDTGVTPHGMNAKEFELMVEKGMSTDAAIRSATVVAAEALGMEEEIGRLLPGMSADIVAVDSSPLDDIRQLQAVRFVMVRGNIAAH